MQFLHQRIFLTHFLVCFGQYIIVVQKCIFCRVLALALICTSTLFTTCNFFASHFSRAETKKVKNVSANQFGDKLGRIHLGRQDLSSMKVRSRWSKEKFPFVDDCNRVPTRMPSDFSWHVSRDGAKCHFWPFCCTFPLFSVSNRRFFGTTVEEGEGSTPSPPRKDNKYILYRYILTYSLRALARNT